MITTATPGVALAAEPARGEAGRRSDDIRSDLFVAVEALDVADAGGDVGAGIDLVLRSRVAALFGDDIRATVERTLHALGVAGARVAVDDYGAVPWVIAARVEAAALAAGLARADADVRPPVTRPDRAPSPRDRLRRSRLYLPGAEPKFMFNAGLHRPDAVILDLEDSVHPEHKAAARLLVRNALRVIDFGAAERTVRINQLPLGLDDLDAIVPEAPDLILIPKTERPEQVQEVDARIQAIRAGLPGGDALPPIWLLPILESALGIENAFAIAAASPNVVALTIGLEDYTADLGVVKTAGGAESLWARQRLVNAARAAGVQAIDSVYGDVQDEAGLFAWGVAARAMGFCGMGCVHPRQIRVIHRAFAPTADELAKAERIVAAFEDAAARGAGVVSLGSKMIDAPVVIRARQLVERARLLAHENDGGES
jgi:citrate lyase subunit beta / citryl-CoA lyase